MAKARYIIIAKPSDPQINFCSKSSFLTSILCLLSSIPFSFFFFLCFTLTRRSFTRCILDIPSCRSLLFSFWVRWLKQNLTWKTMVYILLHQQRIWTDTATKLRSKYLRRKLPVPLWNHTRKASRETGVKVWLLLWINITCLAIQGTYGILC